MNNIILSHLPNSALNQLRDIFNASLSAGYFPDRFKEVEMRMIVKCGKVTIIPDSYRPISVQEVPGKFLERVITRRLLLH